MTKRILFITGNYLPGKNGGIENYTHWLGTLLMQRDFQVEVAALNVKEKKDYTWEGVNVTYLKDGFASFKQILKENFDICHFHEYSSYGGIDSLWFIEAKKYSKKVFFTFHLPYLTCYKGDFRFNGIKDCDDFSSIERCVECCIATKLKYKANSRRNIWNLWIETMLPVIKKSNQVTVLRKNIVAKKSELEALITNCDTIFIYGKWFKKLLEKNGYRSQVIKEISHISDTNLRRNKRIDYSVKNKVVFVGRIEKQKGLHLLCNAMNLLSVKDIQLDVFGNIVDEKYFNTCQSTFRFNYKGSIPRNQLINTFTDYDFLILPSVFTEMNSLVLREAMYEHLPVIVSNAKGNKDVVKDSVNGFLFEYNNAKNLALIIIKAYSLRREGWVPVFTYPENAANNIEEIVSNYF